MTLAIWTGGLSQNTIPRRILYVTIMATFPSICLKWKNVCILLLNNVLQLVVGLTSHRSSRIQVFDFRVGGRGGRVRQISRSRTPHTISR